MEKIKTPGAFISSKTPSILWIILLPLLAWVLSQQARLLSTLENNTWSISVARQAFSTTVTSDLLPAPPPMSLHARLWLGRLFLRQQLPQQAQEWVAPLAARGDPFALDTIAIALYLQGQYPDAFEAWAQIGNIYALEKVANDARDQGQLDVTILAYRYAYDLAPERYTLNLAILLRQQKQYSEAETLLQRALQTYSDSEYLAVWLHELGNIYRNQQRWTEAEASYRQALSESPTDWEARIGLGWVLYQRNKDLDGALSNFQEAIEIIPDRGDGYNAIGTVLNQEGRYIDASLWFKQAMERDPSNPWYHLTYANALRSANELDAALKKYEEIIIQFPDFPTAYYEISWAYHLNHQPEQAIQAIEKFLGRNPLSNSAFYVRAGLIYEATGEKENAIEAFKNALKLDPQNQIALNGLARLK